MKKIIKLIDIKLISYFGIPLKNQFPPDPVEMLIATILSQNTNDTNSYKAYKELKKKYPRWEMVLKAKTTSIENVIKIAGLGKQKSNAIKSFLLSLYEKTGSLNLNYLNIMKDDEIINELISYKGVGVKTASCVLLFSMGRNVCPVDTHVHRTLNRIGLVKTSSPDKTFYLINQHIPDGTAHSFHTNLIRLGREICKPGKPACTVCPLEKLCKYEEKHFDRKEQYGKNSFMLLDNINSKKTERV
jgi:endonuclease III